MYDHDHAAFERSEHHGRSSQLAYYQKVHHDVEPARIQRAIVLDRFAGFL